MAHRSPLEIWLLPVALGLGITAALSPSVLGGVVALCGLLAASIFVALQPQQALQCAFFLVMLAETKFRMRDPAALLAGDVDSQIVFELCLYGIMLFVVIRNFLSSAYHAAKLTFVECVLGGYVMLVLCSCFWAADFRITAVRGVQLCILYALCFVGIRVLGPQRMLRTLTASVVVYVLLFTLLAVVFPWANGTRFTQTTHIARFTWFALHPITAAAYAGTAALCLVAEGLFAQGAWRRRLLGLPLWLPLIPLLLVLLATRSRGALVAFLVTLVALGLRRYVNPWLVGLVSYSALVLTAIVLGLGLSLSASTQQLLDDASPLGTFLMRGQAIDEFFSLTGRTELWQQVYGLFLERPLLGYGYIASRSLLLKVLPWAGEAHNALAESLLDVGVLGTVLLWYALISAMLSSLFQTPRASGMGVWQHASTFGALFFLLLHSLVDAAFAGTPGYQVLLLFATVLAYDRLKRVAWPFTGTPDTGSWPLSSIPPHVLEAAIRWVRWKRLVSDVQKT
jgi:O-antigen ligase